MLISSPRNNMQAQELPKDFRSAVLNAVRTFNMTIMELYSDIFTKDTKEDSDNENISLFANAFILEYVDDGISYAIVHNDATLWVSTDDSLPTNIDDITNMLFDYYDNIVSEANKVRKKLK